MKYFFRIPIAVMIIVLCAFGGILIAGAHMWEGDIQSRVATNEYVDCDVKLDQYKFRPDCKEYYNEKSITDEAKEQLENSLKKFKLSCQIFKGRLNDAKFVECDLKDESSVASKE